MADINLAEARELCTAVELKLFQSSRGKELNAQSAAQLKKSADRARKLRDKWRDLAHRQKRATQKEQARRGTADKTRSVRKAQLFQEVFNRLDARLQKLNANGESPQSKAKANTTAKKPTKSQRAQGHRAARAGVREALQRKQEELAASNQTAAPSAPVQTGEEVAEAASQPASGGNGAPTRRKPAVKPTRSQIPALLGRPGMSVDPKRQQNVKAVANQQRVKASGLNTRVRGHVSGRGKRAQAARNSRKRT